MGRSRGGLTTKIHALVDACGLPIRLKVTEGQTHDGRSAQDMIDTVGCSDVLLADRAYDSNALRQTLAARGARANVKPMPNRVTACDSPDGSIASAIWSNASSTKSSIIARSPPATTNVTTTSSPASSSPQSASGCDLMSR
jgi:transposase